MLIAIISDIHDDILNLEKALNFIHKQSALKIACLGDIVGYTKKYFETSHKRNANACIELVRQHCDFVVAGNHDKAAIGEFPGNIKDIGLPDDWFDLSEDKQFESSGGMLWTYDDHEPDILPESHNYLKSLNEFEIMDADGSQIMLSHYPFPDLTGFRSRFIGFAEELKDHFEFMKRKKCHLAFSGHRHVEGMMMAGKAFIKEGGFTKHKLTGDILWVDGPCITSGKRESGLILFDSQSMEAEAVSLKMI